mmetsp:Transcript_36729/g.68346  ORF Transcript_36729/g.68346 Transcript_36729/m.68346 type:complete len:105 (-) Transcript_36729:570-884(-)
MLVHRSCGYTLTVRRLSAGPDRPGFPRSSAYSELWCQEMLETGFRERTPDPGRRRPSWMGASRGNSSLELEVWEGVFLPSTPSMVLARTKSSLALAFCSMSFIN